jgi:hypothetical protein
VCSWPPLASQTRSSIGLYPSVSYSNPVVPGEPFSTPELVLLGSAWLMFDLPVACWKPWSGVVLAMASLAATVLGMGTVPGPMGSMVIATVMQGLLVGLFAHSVASTNRTPKPAVLADHKLTDSAAENCVHTKSLPLAVLPHSWHLDPGHYTSPIKVTTRTRQDDSARAGRDRALLSRGSEVRVLPGAPSAGAERMRGSNPARALRVQRAPELSPCLLRPA